MNVVQPLVSLDLSFPICILGAMSSSLVAQMVKNPPAIQETWIQSLGQKNPLEKELATHSSEEWPGESYGQRSLVGYSPWGHKVLDTTE